MKNLILILLVTFAVSANAETTANPMKYAKTVAADYAVNSSDMEPYGLEYCEYVDPSDENVQIKCEGTNTVLVFGGHKATGTFTCEFEFKKVNSKLYEVVTGAETCD